LEGFSLSSAKINLNAPVETVMRSPPVKVLFSDTVATVIDKMLTYDIGAVIVEMGGKPVGIITEKDILSRVVRAGKSPSSTYAQEVMSKPLITIEADKPISEALKLMRDNKIRRLAVTRRGSLVGILTERRIIDALV
jgi:CBS domain-containing protein